MDQFVSFTIIFVARDETFDNQEWVVFSCHEQETQDLLPCEGGRRCSTVRNFFSPLVLTTFSDCHLPDSWNRTTTRNVGDNWDCGFWVFVQMSQNKRVRYSFFLIHYRTSLAMPDPLDEFLGKETSVSAMSFCFISFIESGIIYCMNTRLCYGVK